MLTFEDLWCGPKEHRRYEERRDNCRAFMRMLNALPNEVAEAAHQPNRELAPWHIKFDYGFAGVINVWPHKLRFQKDGAPSVADLPGWSRLYVEVGCTAAHHRAVTGKEKAS